MKAENEDFLIYDTNKGFRVYIKWIQLKDSPDNTERLEMLRNLPVKHYHVDMKYWLINTESLRLLLDNCYRQNFTFILESPYHFPLLFLKPFEKHRETVL